MQAKTKGHNGPLIRALRILKALKGHSLDGMSNGELANAINDSAVNVSRVMETLVEEGMVKRLESGRYAPGQQLLYIAMAFTNEMSAGQARIAELTQSVIAGSKK